MVIDYATDGKDDVAALCNLSLISHQWYGALNDKIYSKWRYDGARHSVSSLWKFLRTILCNRRLADQVQELDIQDWTFGLVPGRSRLVLTEDNLDLIRISIYTTGLQRIKASILEAVRKADPRPLMALLLASLPNLTRLYAHLPETDIFFAEVLRNSIRISNYPLRRLREVYLASTWNYRTNGRIFDEYYALELDTIWPIFQLPNIQKLSVFDFKPLGAFDRCGDCFRSSSLTDLTLVHHVRSQVSFFDTEVLFDLPKTLRKLSFYLYDCDVFQSTRQISNADLWNCIKYFDDCLEHLDIYRECTGCHPPKHSNKISHFESMRGFKRLRSLCIQPEVLLGGCCGDDIAPHSLADTLPLALQSLTLYGDEGLSTNKTLGQQLHDVIASTDFQCLDQVALEESYESIQTYDDPADQPHEAVEQSCRERGIHYESKPPWSVTKGGIGSQYYGDVCEKRWEMAGKLVNIRRVLTAHLRLRKALDQDGDSIESVDDYSTRGHGGHSTDSEDEDSTHSQDEDSTDGEYEDFSDTQDEDSTGSGDDYSTDGQDDDSPTGPTEFSTEDLDTYELPWDELIADLNSRPRMWNSIRIG